MFVDISTEVSLPEGRVAELLISHSSEMEGLGAAAYRRGEELRSRVGPGGLLAKEIVIGLGPPSMSRRGVVIPLRWRATGAETLFPSLEGELIVKPAGPTSSVLQLLATYRPPLGPLGTFVDRMLLARVARATVADWVERIAAWLMSAEAESLEGEGDLHHGAGTQNRT
jgi:hypothetical protein